MTEQSDLPRMILAARQIGEVTGEDLLTGFRFDEIRGHIWFYDDAMLEQDALDLLTARVWRAVQGWCRANSRYIAWDWYGVYMQHRKGPPTHTTEHEYPDLPSAVAAIHKHWKENR